MAQGQRRGSTRSTSGLIVTLNLGIGQQTPPMASVLVIYVPAIPLALVDVFYH